MENNNWIIFDGNMIPADEPIVPAVSRGLMYGDGVFETFRTYSGQTLFLQKHIDRLYQGLDILEISFRFDLIQLKKLILDLLSKNKLLTDDGIVRLQVWRDGQRGYHPDDNSEIHFSLTASACPVRFNMPNLVTVAQRRIPSESLPTNVKFTNSINYILAAREAAEKGGDEALMQTVDGHISETTIANIFWIRDDNIYTPSVKCDLIPGITRDIVLQIIDQKNLEVKVGEFPPDHILKADSAFICNSVREILPVGRVDTHNFNNENELLIGLKERFIKYRDQNLKPLDVHD